jgi:hypothetical protein
MWEEPDDDGASMVLELNAKCREVEMDTRCRMLLFVEWWVSLGRLKE